ncbi:L2 [Duck papillomavirus 3]|uniref:L2 n=1 Tax=Duck papillomavirus 3 TaxID=2562546 RepID=A0AAE5YMN3_9PAPI|nr:L2 [Duck papillomavirus 3]
MRARARVRVRVRFPSPTDTWLRKYFHGLFIRWPRPGVGRVRRPRAAADDLWRGCLEGRDCPPDIYNTYTHNTTADKILTWGSAGTFFGELGVGTGSGTAVPEGPIGVDWSVLSGSSGGGDSGSFIPRERPFRLPGSEIPVRVDAARENPTPVRPVPPEPPGTTFVNPAFDGDVVSVSSSDNVVIAPPAPVPGETGAIPVPELPEGPYTRGDTFVYEHELTGDIAPDRRPYFPFRPAEAGTSGPFETFELATLTPAGALDPAVEQASTSFGGDSGWAFAGEDLPYTSTPELPRPGRPRGPPRFPVLQVENPLYDSGSAVQAAFEAGVSAALEDIEVGSPLFTTTRDRAVQVSRVGQARGMSLRSGREVPYIFRLLGEVSPIGPADPSIIELRSLAPVGASDTVVDAGGLAETSLSGHSQVPWDNRPLPIDDPLAGYDEDGFMEIPLIDEAGEEEAIPVPATRARALPADVVGAATRAGFHSTPLVKIVGRSSTVVPAEPYRPTTVQPGSYLPPMEPGVVVQYYTDETGTPDPLLLWWFLRRRRRLFNSFYR